MKTSLLLLPMVALLAGAYLGGRALSQSSAQEASAPPVASPTAAGSVVSGSSTEVGAPTSLDMPAPEGESGSIPPVVPVVVPDLPKPVADIVLLAQRTLSESVLVHFVDTLQEPFELDGEQVIYLSDLGIPDGVISALLRRSQILAGRGPVVSEEPMIAELSQPETQPETAPQVQLSEPTAAQYRATFQAPEANAPVYGQPQPVAPPVQQAGPAPEMAQAPAVQAPTQQVTYNVFYESLSPYGNWVQAPSYGWVWQPTVAVVNPGWQPYVHGGRWMWSDYGWYWNSTYSWGWAPFHYGRWHQSGLHGWVWVPGRTWGPAWVAWRYDSAYCGWAPLPPEAYWSPGIGFSWSSRGSRVGIGFGIGVSAWAVAPWGGFCAPRLPAVCLPRHSTGHFVNNTSIKVSEGQAVNIVGNNNTVIINNAVSRDQVQRHVRDEIRKVAITDAPTPGRSSIAARPSTDGASARPQIAAYRPQIQDTGGEAPAPPSSLLTRQEERKYAATRPATTGRTGNAGSATAPGSRSVVPTRDGQVSATRPGDSAIRPNVAPSGRDPSARPSATRPATGGTPGSDSLATRPVPSATRPSGTGATAPSTGAATRPTFSSTRVAGNVPQTTPAVRPGTQATYPSATTGTRPPQTQSQVRPSTVPGRPTSQSLPSSVTAARPQGSGLQSNYQQNYQQQAPQQQQQPIQRYPQRQEVPKAVPSYPGSMAPVPQTGRPAYNQNSYSAPATRGTVPSAARPSGVAAPSTPTYSRPTPSYSRPVQSAPSRSTYSRPSSPAPSPRLNSGSIGSTTRSVPSASRPTPVQSAPATRPSR